MKNKIFSISFLLCFVFLIENISFSQSIWSTQYLSNVGGNNLRRLTFVNSVTGWACGGGGVLIKTTNAGDSWVPVNIGLTSYLTAIFFINENTGWVGTTTSVLRKTTDGGTSWTSQGTPIGTHVGYIQFFNAMTGYVSGDGPSNPGLFAKTTDGGTSWITQAISTFAWGDIQFINQQTGWIEAPGYFGKTTDGGVTWARLLFDGPNQGFYFLNEQLGWVASPGVLKKTVNGGASWSFYSLPISGTPYRTYFFNENMGWTAGPSGSSGVLCRTTNGGVNWLVQKTETGNAYYDFNFINTNVGWASGNAIISGTTNGGLVSVTSVSTSAPDSYSLKQNFPNPFNPATSIKFDIKKTGFVTLKVYSMEGAEVKSLVNENVNPGSYEAKFDASGLPSGTYFYTLSTSEFKETKKMMLIK